jgi:cytochrome c oxidase subunit 2
MTGLDWTTLTLPTLAEAAAAAGTAAAQNAGGSKWWFGLPENVSSFGAKIDSLYWLITAIVAGIFVLTQGALVWCLIRYRARPGGKSQYIHGSVAAEFLWTAIPAGILIWLTIVQAKLWNEIKTDLPSEEASDVVVVEVLAKQYAWHFRYRGPEVEINEDGEAKPTGRLAPFGTKFDIYSDKLYVPLGKKVVYHLNSLDVVHSFFLPHFRVKQDAVPGLAVRGWFDTEALKERIKAGEAALPAWDMDKQSGGRDFEIVCTELCGPQHYKMGGRLVILSEDDFKKQMARLQSKRDDKLADGHPGGGDPGLGYDPAATAALWSSYKLPADSVKTLAEFRKTEKKPAAAAAGAAGGK